MNKTIDFLLKNTNSSIHLRVKKEILGNITAQEEADLIAQIKEEPIYKLIVSCQKENGWLGNGFHGPNKNARLYENQLKGISTYGGQQLENDWKIDTRKLCDITFRALLIMFYANK